MRTDRVYWARLRKDKRSNWAGGLVIVSALCATVCCVSYAFTGSPGEMRLNLLYWAFFIPLAVWGSAMTGFDAWAVRLLRPVAVTAPVVTAVATWLTWWQGGLSLAIDALLLAVGMLSAVAGLLLYRGSLLQREGPSR